MKKIVIAGYARSPFALANKGALVDFRADDIAAQVVLGLLRKTGLPPEKIEDLIMGCAFPEGEQGLNIARLVVLLAGLPISIAGQTINRFCGSSMQSIHAAAGAIQMNAGDAFIAMGVESMSRVPMSGFNPLPNPDLAARMRGAYMGMGETAENVAKQYKITRKEQEEFALRSQKKAYDAQGRGRLTEEIIPVTYDGKTVSIDSCLRPETTLEKMAELKPAFDTQGSVTAATSSPLTDGAAATIVCSEEFARAHGLKPLAAIRSFAVAGCAPEVMGLGPVGATRKALARAGLTVADLDVIELNEAFASQSIACIRDLGLDEAKINIDGGAIAIGHPLGATGARITAKAAQIMQREGKRLALATQCIGGGQGIATILEAI